MGKYLQTDPDWLVKGFQNPILQHRGISHREDALTRWHGDDNIRDSEIYVHAAERRLRQRQRQVCGRQQVARLDAGAAHGRGARQRAHHDLQSRDPSIRHHALRTAPQFEASLHLDILWNSTFEFGNWNRNNRKKNVTLPLLVCILACG